MPRYVPSRPHPLTPGAPPAVENTVVDRSPSFDADTSIEQQRAVLHAKAMALITEANNPGQVRPSWAPAPGTHAVGGV